MLFKEKISGLKKVENIGFKGDQEGEEDEERNCGRFLSSLMVFVSLSLLNSFKPWATKSKGERFDD